MKSKSYFLLIIFTIISWNLHSQSDNYNDNLSFRKKNLFFTFGVGSDDLFSSATYGDNIYLDYSRERNTSMPTFYKIDYATGRFFSFGLHLIKSSKYFEGYQYINSNYFQEYYISDFTTINARLNVNIPFDKYFTFYYGLGVGIRMDKYIHHYYDGYKYVDVEPTSEFNYDDSNLLGIPLPASLGFEATFGMRYFPVKYVGLYWEAGINKSVFQGGLVVKI